MKIHDAVENDLIERGGIHFLPDNEKFAYNDGDQAEAFLLRVLRGASDVSSRSRELEARAKDWVSRYHFSRSRSLSYQSLAIPADASVLEVGSGSGAITRYFGECAGSVLAIEGSPRRAAMTRLRTRDQHNVSVLCATFERICFSRRFDIVICNGVLEYASLFMSSDNPASRMLEILSGLLNPAGTLLVAIENKFGLRYFSSACEEHTGVAFDGLEGYARHPKGAMTYGRVELEALLRECFGYVEFLLPLPDYKLPKAIIRERLLQEADCSELFASAGSGHCGTTFRPQMHERLVWHQLGANGLLANCSNSFLVLAGQMPSPLLPPSWRGDVYSINRSPGLEVRTRISTTTDGSVVTEKSYLHNAPLVPAPFLHRLESVAWSNGESVHTAISRTMLAKTAASLEDRLRPLVVQWWSAVVDEAGEQESGVGGLALDLNWENSMIENGGVRFIDSEWAVDRNVPREWLLYRVVSKFVDTEWDFRHRWDARWRNASKRRLLMAVGSVLGVPITFRSLLQSIQREGSFQRVAVGASRPAFRVLLEDCVPFWVAYSWKEWVRHLGRFRGRVARNLRRLLSVES